MKVARLWRFAAGLLACAVLAGVLPLGAVPGARFDLGPSSAEVSAQGSTSIHFPLVGRNYLDPTYRCSRFGISHVNLVDQPAADLNAVRVGHHLNFAAQAEPPRPGGIDYYQVVRLTQVGDDGYTSSPSGAELLAAVDANRGALWLIGNEPDRVKDAETFQDDIVPHVYAKAYGELYRQIKGRDPSARIGAGNIVQPTPVRMRYLDMVLQAYRGRNGGAAMPVDVWSVHVYILPECPDIGWGAKMPPGVTNWEGCTRYVQWDNADVSILKGMIQAFREWMAANGYRETPLYVTEFGVLMPWDMVVKWSGNEEDAAKARLDAEATVLSFMSDSIGYMLSKTSVDTGYPADGNRLVQRWAWYSHSDLATYNGHLFDPVTKQRTIFGERYATLIAAQPATVNLYAWKMRTEPASGSIKLSQLKQPVRIHATVVNNGSVAPRNAVAVRFYDGNPASGGVQIGETQYVAPPDGGAGLASVSVSWMPPRAETYQLHVRVDPANDIAETNEGDNAVSIGVEVAP